MINLELERELRGYEGDKRLTKLAVASTQQHMKDALMGNMGEDIKAVLNGEREIKISTYKKKKFQLLSWFKKLLRKF